MRQRLIHTALLTALAILLFATACERKEKISAELGSPMYDIKPSDAPIDQLIYTIKDETGIQVVYDFHPADAQWNLGTSQNVLTAQAYVPFSDPNERPALQTHVERLKEDFLSLYPLELKQSFFPLRVYLCDSIIFRKKDQLSGMGRDHIAANVLSSKDQVPADEYHQKLWVDLHKHLWKYIFTYRLEVPVPFTAFTENVGEYGKRGPEITKPDNVDPREFGFWEWDTKNYCGKYNCVVTLENDIADYIIRMVSMNEEEVKEAMGGYDIMHSKYEILRTFIRQKTGVDLQEIGNRASKTTL